MFNIFFLESTSEWTTANPAISLMVLGVGEFLDQFCRLQSREPY